jgi:hypothetical protein
MSSNEFDSLVDDSQNEGFEVRCVMGIIRHADRTCKQKIVLKFGGEPPQGLTLNEDIRSPEGLIGLRLMIESRRADCRSESTTINNALRIMLSGREDVKVKIETNDSGWILKLKWGGTLTQLGQRQAEAAGASFRHRFCPCSNDLDVRFFASTDTRCQETARAFASSFHPAGDVSIRSEDGPDGLGNLDDTPFRHSPLVKSMRTEIARLLMSGRKIDDDFKAELFQAPCSGLEALEWIKTEFGTFAYAVSYLKALIDDFSASLGATLQDSPELDLMRSRWLYIHKAFQRTDSASQSAAFTPRSRWKSQQTNSGVWFTSLQVSLIGDIHDNSQFDFRHNVDLLNGSDHLRDMLNEIRQLTAKLTAIIIPLEYGVTREDKAFIGSTFLHPLIRKLRFDLRLATNLPLGDEEIFVDKQGEVYGTVEGPARVRIYFAHHSHVFSFVSILESVEELFPSNFYTNADFLLHNPSLGYLCELVVSVARHKVTEKWRLTIDLFPGDSFSDRSGSLSFDPVRIVDGVTETAAEIDDIFTTILGLPARDGLYKVPSHLRLPTIGEMSRETLFEDDLEQPSFHQ